MIRVTRLDRQEIALNSDLIESIEARPDTTIRLVTGQSLVVREPLEDVLERVRAWRSSVLGGAGLAGLFGSRLGGPRRIQRASGSGDDPSDTAFLEIPA